MLFSFAGSGDQWDTAWVDTSPFLTAWISYHFEERGVFTNWSRSSPLVSEHFLFQNNRFFFTKLYSANT